MELRTLAMAVFLITWSTLGGLLSGIVMGLFFIVYQDGYRKGVLPPQREGRTFGFLDSPSALASLTSRFSGGLSLRLR